MPTQYADSQQDTTFGTFRSADKGKRRTEWAFQSMPVLQTIRKQFISTQPLAGIRDRGLPARDHRDRQSDGHAAGRRRLGGAVRLQPAFHAGRRGRDAGPRLRHPGVRHQGREQRSLLLAHRGGARPQAAHHHGRRRRPGDHAAHQAAGPARRASSAAPRRPPPA